MDGGGKLFSHCSPRRALLLHLLSSCTDALSRVCRKQVCLFFSHTFPTPAAQMPHSLLHSLRTSSPSLRYPSPSLIRPRSFSFSLAPNPLAPSPPPSLRPLPPRSEHPRSAPSLTTPTQDPNTYFREALEAERVKRGLSFPVEVVGLRGEDIDAPSGTYDRVVSTHVFCSVHDQMAVLKQVRRRIL